MTPELQKEIIVGVLSAFFTALFTGIPAIALLWWTWARDQERLVVQKLVSFGKTLEGNRVPLKDNYGPVFGILIRNRSLFSVHVSAVGFEIDREVIQLERPAFPMNMKRNPDQLSNRLYIANDNSDPRELSSGASVQVSVHDPADRSRLTNALRAAATKHERSMDDFLVYSPKVIAMVALESGKIFTSMPLRKRIWRRVLQIKREMDGEKRDVNS